MSLFEELKRRNVFRVGIAYILLGWAVLQGADFLLDLVDAPGWVTKVFAIAGLVGFPFAVFFAWAYELTPDGIKREKEVDRSQSITPQTGKKLNGIIISLLLVVVAFLLIDRFILNEHRAPASEHRAVGQYEARAEPGISAPGQSSVAVLPFVNMSADPEQEYFSDGLAEELLNRLAKIEQLHVAARTSSFQFKGQNLDISDIGRQLRVAHILEGSVRKAGERVRITAQLIKVDDGFHVWSETYERQLDDIFDIQDEISGAIADALKLELGAAPQRVSQTENRDAYQLFLQARYLLARRGEANMREAAHLFEKSLDLDADFARAWAGLAYTWAMLPSYAATDTVFARRKVEEAASRALALDPDNPEPYLARARLQSTIDGQIAAASANFEKAYEMAPNNVDVVNLYGDFLFTVGRLEEAETMERRAVELDPLDPIHHADVAGLLATRHEYDESLEYARTAARLAPDLMERQDALVWALIYAGHVEEAEQTIDRLASELRDDRGYFNAWRCGLAFAKGDVEGLRALVAERVARPAAGSVDNFSFAAWYALWVDGPQAALPLVQQALANDESALSWPMMFYLPEMYSDDPDWLAFWEQPKLADLIAARRANWNGEPLGQWKTPPWQH
jgi:TolB-like protein